MKLRLAKDGSVLLCAFADQGQAERFVAKRESETGKSAQIESHVLERSVGKHVSAIGEDNAEISPGGEKLFVYIYLCKRISTITRSLDQVCTLAMGVSGKSAVRAVELIDPNGELPESDIQSEFVSHFGPGWSDHADKKWRQYFVDEYRRRCLED